MQQWYICPKCGRYVQYGQPQCYYCGYQMYWQAPEPSVMGKMKSIFQILSQKTPPVQYPIPVPPPPPPVQDPSPIQDPAPVQPSPIMQPPAPVQPPSAIQLPGPAQAASVITPPEPVQRSPIIQPPAPIETPSSMQPPPPVQPPEIAPVDKLKSILGIPFQTPPDKQPQQKVNPRQEAVSDTPQDRRNLKDTLTAYLYWLCLGSHYIYLKKMRIQVIFWLTLGGLGMWWLIDLIRLPGMVNDYNIDQLLNAVLVAEKLNNRICPRIISRISAGRTESRLLDAASSSHKIGKNRIFLKEDLVKLIKEH